VAEEEPVGSVILYIAASLDGCIADREGGVGWLKPYDAQDYGYNAFMNTVGTVIMGRATYEQIPTFGVAWPYAGRKTVVFTHHALPLFDPSVELYAGSPEVLVANIRSASERHLWLVGGCALIGAFINAGLVDQIRLFVIPTFVGQGVPLFRDIAVRPALQLLGSAAYPNGVAQLHYEVTRTRPAKRS
jgi:dihydrofolate reductase